MDHVYVQLHAKWFDARTGQEMTVAFFRDPTKHEDMPDCGKDGPWFWSVDGHAADDEGLLGFPSLEACVAFLLQPGSGCRMEPIEGYPYPRR